MPFSMEFPFLAMLELLDVSRLMNDPIIHLPYWPLVQIKISSDCPKFEGKAKEDPQTHMMTYHLSCSSNSYVNDSIYLQLFQRNVTGTAVKWYIELPQGTYGDFNSLAMAFLNHFQLRFDMKLALIFLHPLSKTPRPTFPIISMKCRH